VTAVDKLLLRILTGLVSTLTGCFVLWATWLTVEVFQLERELAVLKAANHLAVVAPELLVRPKNSPQLAYPGFFLPEIHR
jgi:hypothetical protein